MMQDANEFWNKVDEEDAGSRQTASTTSFSSSSSTSRGQSRRGNDLNDLDVKGRRSGINDSDSAEGRFRRTSDMASDRKLFSHPVSSSPSSLSGVPRWETKLTDFDHYKQDNQVSGRSDPAAGKGLDTYFGKNIEMGTRGGRWGYPHREL